MNYQNVKFTGAYGTSAQIPASERPEVAFVGRSNVGKSSLLNKLLRRKALAKVSSQPGKTSTVNFFCIDGAVDLIDLPGYGFAKVSHAEKQRWDEMINGYFEMERYYALVVSLIDIRHPATKLDVQMVEFLLASGLPFAIALTKADKLSRGKALQAAAALRKQLGLPKEVQVLVTSAESGTGIPELRTLIEQSCQ